MTPFEYALVLFSVLMALVFGDIAMSLHKLIRRGRTIVWDGRVILSVLLVIVLAVRMWFSLWGVRSYAMVLNLPFFLSLFLELMLLFLLAAHSLPDEPEPDCDLGAFYEANSRRLWILFALFQLSFVLHWFYFSGGHGSLLMAAIHLVALALYVLLAAVRSKWLHLAVPLALLATELSTNWGTTLAG
jgi:hypothetical protein